MKKLIFLLAMIGMCSVSEAQVHRTDTLAGTFVVPTAFTFSNESTVYEMEILRPVEIKTIKFIIYNRWGQAMFKGSDEDQTWDGTHDGKNAPEGVYLYYIEGEYKSDEKFQFQGNLNIFRK